MAGKAVPGVWRFFGGGEFECGGHGAFEGNVFGWRDQEMKMVTDEDKSVKGEFFLIAIVQERICENVADGFGDEVGAALPGARGDEVCAWGVYAALWDRHSTSAAEAAVIRALYVTAKAVT